MPSHEFIIRYREHIKAPCNWKESLFSLGEWPYGENLPTEQIEDHRDVTPKWFSVHFWLQHAAGISYDDLRVLAKDYAREVLSRHHPDANIDE